MSRSTYGVVCALLAIGATGCELPQAPSWDLGVLVPFTRQTLSIDDLLPAGVETGVMDGEDAFLIDLTAELADYSLGAMCEACRPLQGTTAPVPSFEFVDTLQVDFPAGLLSLDVVSYRVGYQVTNALNFDPLRPNPDPDLAGSAIVRMFDAGTETLLDSFVLNGATESFPSGTTREFALEVQDASIEGGLLVELVLDSPADGQTITIDTALTASAHPILDTLAVAAVTVEVADRDLNENFQVDFDADLRQELQDNLKSALIELDLAHNLMIEGTLEISLAGSPDDLFAGVGEVRLTPIDFAHAPDGRTLQEVLTGDEIRFLAGLPELHVGFAAVASALNTDSQGRPAVTFTPLDSVSTRLQVTGTLGVEP